MYASSRLFDLKIRIGARPENRQLARTASLCIASGKPLTRFPLGWHVQKGSVLSHIHLVWSLGVIVSWRSLMYINSSMKLLNFRNVTRPTRKYSTISKNWEVIYWHFSVLNTLCVLGISDISIYVEFSVISEMSVFRPQIFNMLEHLNPIEHVCIWVFRPH